MKILNLKHDRCGPGTVLVDRSTSWGNPYRIGKDGSRAEVIALYRQHLWQRIQSGDLDKRQLQALAGRDLACWCAPAACHAEVIRSAVRWACK